MKRLAQLDSIRGLASLSVMLHHLWQSAPVLPAVFYYSPARIFIGGHQAVILFFILSGFVLALPFLSGKTAPYSAYIIKRICRIYLPYLAALILAGIAASLLHNKSESQVGSFFYFFWQSGFNLRLIAEHLTLLTNFNTNAYNTVIWSLLHEMRISLIFPLLMLLVLRRGLVFNLLICLLLNMASAANDIFGLESSRGFHTSYMDTVYYTPFFIIGALLAKHRAELMSLFQRAGQLYKAAGLAAAILLYAYSRLLSDKIHLPFNRVIDDYGITLAVAFFIILALTSAQLIKLLSLNFISFLGKISYSLYLYHFIVFLTLAYTIQPYIPYWLFGLLTLALSILAATASYYGVEKPAMALGRHLSSYVTRPRAGRSALHKAPEAEAVTQQI
ncbi:acyltransferase family protein [Paenibacillus phytohabitans]|uniref:acyltransferase family protein n=1 Tax=Paenibacillus phytohabitans TaxID=2654978 RepID=UPI00300B2760